jgi:hypothetical protein
LRISTKHFNVRFKKKEEQDKNKEKKEWEKKICHMLGLPLIEDRCNIGTETCERAMHGRTRGAVGASAALTFRLTCASCAY